MKPSGLDGRFPWRANVPNEVFRPSKPPVLPCSALRCFLTVVLFSFFYWYSFEHKNCGFFALNSTIRWRHFPLEEHRKETPSTLLFFSFVQNINSKVSFSFRTHRPLVWTDCWLNYVDRDHETRHSGVQNASFETMPSWSNHHLDQLASALSGWNVVIFYRFEHHLLCLYNLRDSLGCFMVNLLNCEWLTLWARRLY